MFNKIYFTTLIFTIIFLQTNASEKWTDPFSMDEDQISLDKHKLKNVEELSGENTNLCRIDEKLCKETGLILGHYKRTIGLLLGMLIYDRDNTNYYSGVINVQILAENYDLLKEFTKNPNIDSMKLNEIDFILSNILKKSKVDEFLQTFTTWREYLYFNLISVEVGLMFVGLFCLFLTYKLLRANITIWTVYKYLFIIFAIVDFIFTWISLLHDKEIEQMADSHKYKNEQSHCNPNEASFWQYIRYQLGYNNDCRDYHKILFKTYFWAVSPLAVMAHQFGVFVKTPAENIGSAIGTFASALFGSMPWGFNIIMFPVMLIFTLILLCIWFSFSTKTSLKFNFFYMIQMEFGKGGKGDRPVLGDTLSGGNLSKILQVFNMLSIDYIQDKNKLLKPSTSNSSNERREEINEIVCNPNTENQNEPETNINAIKESNVENIGEDFRDANKENISEPDQNNFIDNKENIGESENCLRNRKHKNIISGGSSSEAETQTNYIKNNIL